MIDAPPGATPWHRATVVELARTTSRGASLRLDIAQRKAHLPGQHLVLRLTGEGGYTAQRSYSIVSAPSDPLVELFVERLDDGEVSPFLVEELRVGDELEARGPIGGWFVWRGDHPAVGIGGGSGVVPLVSMLRHARVLGRQSLLTLLVSVRTRDDLPYAEELLAAGATVIATRHRPEGRIAANDLAVLRPSGGWNDATTYFVCGSSPFSTAMSTLLVDSGVPAGAIRVESFGASG